MNFTQLTPYTPVTLVAAADTSFVANYRTSSKQVGGRVHILVNKAISDFEFLKILIYNNDYLKIPPVETFLAFYGSSLMPLNDDEKRCLGGLFGNLFRFVLGYNIAEKKQYRRFIVASASYFIK